MIDKQHARNCAMDDILVERSRQDRLKEEGRFKFTAADPDVSDMTRLSFITEEVGEVARCCLGDLGIVQDGGGLHKEVTQIAAIALAWLEGRYMRGETLDATGRFDA